MKHNFKKEMEEKNQYQEDIQQRTVRCLSEKSLQSGIKSMACIAVGSFVIN